MAKLKPDSPLSRRVLLAFFDFLDSVEHDSSADEEAVEVARDCLTEAFKIDPSAVERQRRPDLLATIFSSLEAYEKQHNNESVQSGSLNSVAAATATATFPSVADKSPPVEVGDTEKESTGSGMSKDDLCAQFFAALEKIHFFKQNVDDSNLMDKLTRYFDDAITDMENGAKAYNINNLAESFKSRGNKSLQSKLYLVAIELYSCAIALCDNNGVYYCNRAAAFTHIQRYSEAIEDCLKSIEIDPTYSKAYSRLGLAYYAQGNYAVAIDKGFRKALQLDPNNESIKDNIKMAELNLSEEMQRAQHNQDGYTTNFSFGGNDLDSQSSSIPPFNISGFPAELGNMFSNITANLHQNISHDGSEQPSNRTAFSIPDINLGNLDGQTSQDIMRSVMSMLSGGTPPQQGTSPQHGTGQSNPN